MLVKLQLKYQKDKARVHLILAYCSPEFKREPINQFLSYLALKQITKSEKIIIRQSGFWDLLTIGGFKKNSSP